MSKCSHCSSTGEGGSFVCDDQCPKRMEANGQKTNAPHSTDHSANGSASRGIETNLNEQALDRSLPEPLRNDQGCKRSPSIFGLFRLSKNVCTSKTFSLMRQESPREAHTLMEPLGKEETSTIDSANVSPSVSNLEMSDSLSGGPLKHAINLRSVRPLMSSALFPRRSNTLSAIFRDIKGYHERCHSHIEIELQQKPINKEDGTDLNRTAPVIPEEMTMTMDESKRLLRHSQELLARLHFPTRNGKELGSRHTTKRKETTPGDGTAVYASDFNNGNCEISGSSETSRLISMELPSADVGETGGGGIFSELLQSLDLAIEFLEQKEVCNLGEMANEISPVKMINRQANCLRVQLIKTREMIEARLAINSSEPDFNQKVYPTVSHFTIKAPSTSPNEPSHWPMAMSPSSPKFDCKGFPIISPVHSGTSSSPNDTLHRPLPNSMNQDDGTSGIEKMREPVKLCTPTTSTANRFSEHSSTNRDSRRTPDPQRPILASIPTPFGNLSFSRRRSLNLKPVGFDNSNQGTTCYINAGLQLLSSVPEILKRVEEGIQFHTLEGKSRLEASVAYKSFMEDRARELNKPSKKESIKNLPVANMMFMIYPDRFKPNIEEDCVEFLTLLLLKIHQELGEEYSPSVLFTGVQRRFRSKASRATESEADGANASNSPPPAQEEFNVITLHFTAQHGLIEDAFNSYTTKEQSSDEEFIHWCKFEVLPSLLLVHVMSYDDSKPVPQKALRKVPIDEILQFRKEWMYEAPRATKVSIPSDHGFGILIADDLEKDGASKQVLATPPRYLIRAVVFHRGSRTTSGHYTAAVFLPGKCRQRVWYYCNDHIVKQISLKTLNRHAKIAQVTLLLYERDC